MTNDLFRDLLDNKIPGHVTPTMVWVNIMPKVEAMTIFGNRYTRPEYWALMQASVNNALERMENIRQAMSMFSVPMWIDYGAQRGLTGAERAHFNDAVHEMSRTTGWSREDSARNLGIFMDATERAELKFQPHPNSRCAPSDPRARALNHNQNRGTGPQPDTLRNRGRITRYKEKG